MCTQCHCNHLAMLQPALRIVLSHFSRKQPPVFCRTMSKMPCLYPIPSDRSSCSTTRVSSYRSPPPFQRFHASQKPNWLRTSIFRAYRSACGCSLQHVPARTAWCSGSTWLSLLLKCNSCWLLLRLSVILSEERVDTLALPWNRCCQRWTGRTSTFGRSEAITSRSHPSNLLC